MKCVVDGWFRLVCLRAWAGNPAQELQNLVQFGVLKPKQRAGLSVFDTTTLYAAKVALFLKAALGTNTELLSEFTEALLNRLPSFREERADTLVFKSRPSPGSVVVEVKVPFRELAQQLEERLQPVELYKDLPRGRKRPGWKREFLATLRGAAREMGAVFPEEALKTVRQYRNDKKQRPEVTVEAESEASRRRVVMDTSAVISARQGWPERRLVARRRASPAG